MQTRRKKYSLVNRPGGVRSPFGSYPVTVTPFGNTPGPFLGIQFAQFLNDGADEETRDTAVTPAAGVASGLLYDIQMVVSHDPGTSIPKTRTQSVAPKR